MERENKGITLIALVVTIIVLLILAGITISLVIGQNGVITRAKEAQKQTEIANIKEQIQMDIVGEQAGNQGNISDATLKEILEKYGTINYEEDGTSIKGITTTEKKYEILLEDIWKGTTSEDERFTRVANAPDTRGFNRSSTYYVAWDLTSNPYTIEENTLISGTAPSNWYDYTAGENKWANIKTTGGGNDCYWVWIPRYAYKVPSREAVGTIDVKFLNGTSNVPIGETEAITNTTPTPGSWVVHPAFTNEGNGGFGELTGIWMAKFESSSSIVSPATVTTDLKGTGGGDTDSLQVRVIPNVTSWRGISVNNIFKVCQNLTTNGNSLTGVAGIDSHMMKNTEWGAVAYLSRSIYGKNSTIWNNPYYNNKINFSPITGLCGTDQDASQTTLTNTYQYNEAGAGNASTTGNVYGVYDMVGGGWEYVAGYLKEAVTNNSTLRANFQSLYDADSKYKDEYAGNSSSDEVNYEANSGKYGDAIYEISTSGNGNLKWDWCFVDSSIPAIGRGGHAMNNRGSGVFTFNRHYRKR